MFKDYAATLALFLDRTLGVPKERLPRVGVYNPKRQTAGEIIITHQADDPRVPHAPRLDPSFLSAAYSPLGVSYRNHLIGLNPLLSKKELFVNKKWDIRYYDQLNYPVILGQIEGQEKFSQRKGSALRFLDMPLYMPDQGWHIPPELAQFEETIAKAIAFEREVNPRFEKNCYVYITVDQGDVYPKEAQRRTGWHADSYLKIDNTKRGVDIACDHVYVIADNCPTPFLTGPFSVKDIDAENLDEVLARFAKEAEGKTPTFYPDYTLLRLNPYCIHNVGFYETDIVLQRTFVKISISQNKYCKLGNAHNPGFIYDWPMLPRHHVPYDNQALKHSSHRKDRDRFTHIQPSMIDFSKQTCLVSWAKSTIHIVHRHQEVKAEKASPGEMLSSQNGDFLVTMLVAKEGDWKITVSTHEQYFLSAEKLSLLYHPHPQREGIFIPKPLKRKAIELTADVRFLASWGSVQYAKKGDFLMYVSDDDIYAVSSELFEKAFTISQEPPPEGYLGGGSGMD